ncbi:MAG: YdcF family protein [Alphaproteobacteria bacterium]
MLTGDRGRIEQGFFLAQKKLANQILISGVGTERDQFYSKQFKYPGLTLGYEAKNTVGNAEEVREWVEKRKIHSLYLVTSDYHMARSLFELQNQMPQVSMIPYPVISEGKGRFYKIFQEYNKFLFSFSRLTIEKIFSKIRLI